METQSLRQIASEEIYANQASFRSLAHELCALLNANGIETAPYRTPDLPYFSQLSELEQLNALNELGSYVRLCNEVVATGASLLSSSTFTWRAIRDSGLIPPSDLFSKILDTDIVEIYDLENIQKFRNFKFFEFCSYTIEDLYTRPWTELFVRLDEGVTSDIIALITKLIANHDKRVVRTGIGAQTIEEVDSVRKYVSELDVKYLTVLYDRQDKPKAFIGIEHAHRISKV